MDAAGIAVLTIALLLVGMYTAARRGDS